MQDETRIDVREYERGCPEDRDLPGWMAERGAELGVRWRSLCPGRELARPLAELIPDEALEPSSRFAVARAIVAIANAVRRNFPGNLFGDLDVVLGVLEHGARLHGDAWVRETGLRIVELHELFGHGTRVQFRYVHDFLYGFDWARWVRREPASRAGVGPFDANFLGYVRSRGGELLELIARGDEKYRPIAPGVDRNPFAFPRDPKAEACLLVDLARRGWVPVTAWRSDAVPIWDRDFAGERERRARELGLTRPAQG